MLPDWAVKYKEKGTVLEKRSTDSYYLYRVHSERKPGKKYPVLIHDDLIGIVTKCGLEYSIRKIIDVDAITVIPTLSTSLFTLLRENSDKFSSSYLVKVQNRWYFANTTEEQKAVLNKLGIDFQRGLDDVK